MNTILNAIQSNLLEIINVILVGVVTFIGTKIKTIYEEHINDKTKKEIVKATVEYVEQINKTLEIKKTSEEKFNQAKEKAIEWLSEKGINISDTEIEILIESCVNAFNSSIKGDN